MSLTKIALFQTKVVSKIDNINGVYTPTFQEAVTLVAETPSSHRFAAVVYTTNSSNDVINLIKGSSSAILGDKDIKLYIKALLNNVNLTFTVATNSTGFSPSEVILEKKLNNIFSKSELTPIFSNINLTDKDTNGLSLQDYLSANFSFKSTDIFDAPKSSLTRRVAYDKNVINWDDFWNSSLLTQSQKDYATASVDIDIAMSNANKDVRKAIERTLTVSYSDRSWVFNILHGDPASGKTAMVMNDICGLNHIPCVKLNGDVTATIVNSLMKFGPESIDGEVKLTEQESIWLICLKNNLPLVVLFDEINLFNTQQMSLLADIITSGYATVGVKNYRNFNNTIFYFGCYNPNSCKSSEFDGKFKDRAIFFSLEKIDIDSLSSYKQRKFVSKMFPQYTAAAIASYADVFTDLRTRYPEKANDITSVEHNLSLITRKSFPSPEAVKWYVDSEVSRLTSKDIHFSSGSFTPYFSSDVPLSSVQANNEAVNLLTRYIAKVNKELFALTKGIDTKSSDRNSRFYIPLRAYDFFYDLVFCYSSVLKATEFMVYNMLPGGYTLKSGTGANQTGDTDETPLNITKALSAKLEATANNLDAILFSDVSVKDIEDDFKIISESYYQPFNWHTSSTVGSMNNNQSSTSTTSTSSSSSSSIFDEADEL